jgi:hypothetical protein
MPADQISGDVVTFNDVFTKEISAIKDRRREQKRDTVGLTTKDTDSTGEPVLVPTERSNLIGLALSGGGIRSAAFCLGALQALDETKVLDRVDYLSTVSGGGYIGCCLSACLDLTRGEFPFKTTRFEDETPALQHIRDYSNYLLPDGALDAFHNFAIYVRGLVANFILVLPFLLGFAALTIFNYPTVNDLQQPRPFGIHLPNILPSKHFVITTYLALALLVVAILWGVHRSQSATQNEHEIPGAWTRFVGFIASIVFLSAFCELQPFILGTFNVEPKSVIASVPKWINTASVALAPIAAIIAIFARQLGDLVKSATESPRTRAQIAGYLAKAAIYLAALIVPLLLWAAYLNLARLGICADGSANCSAPQWWVNIAHAFGVTSLDRHFHFIAMVYVGVAVICLLLSLLLQPNANSLHPLYRDRLGRAFLFMPQTTLKKDQELQLLQLKLSKLSGKFGPYHIINTALNIQNSKTANKRGRNADFFSFNRDFVGSEATGYVATADVEKTAPGLDFASVMAISGAAASSNMGAETIKPLTPTLALLNIRLGYWLRNPMRIKNWKHWNRLANFYFLAELFGMLNERRKSVYLTDGGHIENLGIYELLKRRCRIIIAIDAEADFELAFGSFNTLVRYARIDLDIEIDLPWEQIRDVNRTIGEEMAKTGNSRKLEGPHCAIGTITYAGGSKGILIYIKSSLTGDENDYVFHYKKRYPGFPHESTVEQMFSEEQFEAYRALGYHSAFGLFDRRDTFAQLDPSEYPDYMSEVALLDHEFPRVTSGGPPRRYRQLVDWISFTHSGASAGNTSVTP